MHVLCVNGHLKVFQGLIADALSPWEMQSTENSCPNPGKPRCSFSQSCELQHRVMGSGKCGISVLTAFMSPMHRGGHGAGLSPSSVQQLCCQWQCWEEVSGQDAAWMMPWGN